MFALATPLLGIVRHGTVHQLKFYMRRPSDFFKFLTLAFGNAKDVSWTVGCESGFLV
jgi:hypothetical protein